MTTKRMWAAAAAVLACSTLSGGHALGQAAQVFFQAVDDGDIRPLTPEEKQGLQDPFFQLVLKNNPGAVKLSDIEGLLQPDAAQRRTFVLDEEIRNPARGQSRRRRCCDLSRWSPIPRYCRCRRRRKARHASAWDR